MQPLLGDDACPAAGCPGLNSGFVAFFMFFVETVDTLVLIWHYYVFGSASSQTSFKSMFSFILNMFNA